jgi:hypothetical protein
MEPSAESSRLYTLEDDSLAIGLILKTFMPDPFDNRTSGVEHMSEGAA